MWGCCRFAVVLISCRKRSAPITARELGLQHLEGDLATVADVLRQVHGRHAALAELPLDAITVRQRASQATLGFAH
jgi:hypothetical protein